MNVTIDYDKCLSRLDVQQYVSELIRRGITVWCLTSRYDELHKHRYDENPTNEDLYIVTDSLGIPRERIRFTCMESKGNYLKGANVIWHLDDNHSELISIQKNSKVVPISVLSGNWKAKCERILNKSK